MNNRIYKFRAWDNMYQKIIMFPSLAELFENYEGEYKRYNLMQFTGLLDKNGNEIYEGDILAPMPNDYKDTYKGNWKVVYDGGAYFGKDADGHHITWLPYWTEQQFKIIGNIYENPELLEGK